MQDVQKLLAEDDAQQAFRRFIDYLRLDAGSGEKRVKEMGSLLAAEYDRFSLKPVGEFCQYAKQTLKPPQLEILLAELRPKAERTQHWVKELDGVTRERLAREARREVTIGGGQVKAAAQRGAVLMQRAKNETDRDKLAKYLIEALGGLTRDIERSYEVIRMLVQAGAMRDLGFDWQEAFKAAAERGKRSGFQESDREWTQIFISACVSIREFLPGKREAGEPTEEQLNNFINEITCVVRAGFASGDDEDLLDALNIVKEYCPTDPPQIQSAAGVEPRLFLDLGPRAKSTAVRGLGQLGNLTMLRARILALAQFAGEERAEMFAAIMGGLRHNDFFFYLKTAFRDAKTPRRQEAIADAVSRLANADSAEMIIAELAKC
ncbi:hypothetical protein HYR69_11745, partial [Candidatus Sumerlaeota bacterium]|nr:hypothetical protein [Candidatus Sumerlaeota bacterium]